jgi:hypothetical protein
LRLKPPAQTAEVQLRWVRLASRELMTSGL